MISHANGPLLLRVGRKRGIWMTISLTTRVIACYVYTRLNPAERDGIGEAGAVADDLPVHEDRHVSAQRRLHFAHRAPGSLGFRAGDVALHDGREHDLGDPGTPFRTRPASARLAETRSLSGATDGVDSRQAGRKKRRTSRAGLTQQEVVSPLD